MAKPLSETFAEQLRNPRPPDPRVEEIMEQLEEEFVLELLRERLAVALSEKAGDG